MADVAHAFIAQSRRFLSDDFLPKIERCLDALSEEDVWWRANESSNSIGNLLLHLAGSTRAWIVGVAGGSPSPRDRQREFDERERIPRAELMSRLRHTLADADEALARLDAGTLLERRQAREEEVTVLFAIYHAVEHFSMHTAQIIMLAKMRSEGLPAPRLIGRLQQILVPAHPLSSSQIVVLVCLFIFAAIAPLGGSLQFYLEQPDTTPRLDNVHRFIAGVLSLDGVHLLWTALTIRDQGTLVYLIALGVFLAGCGRLSSMSKVGLPEPRAVWIGYLIPELVLPVMGTSERRVCSGWALRMVSVA